MSGKQLRPPTVWKQEPEQVPVSNWKIKNQTKISIRTDHYSLQDYIIKHEVSFPKLCCLFNRKWKGNEHIIPFSVGVLFFLISGTFLLSCRIFTQFKRLLKQAFIPNASCLTFILVVFVFSSPIAISHMLLACCQPKMVPFLWFIFYAMNQEQDCRDRDHNVVQYTVQSFKRSKSQGFEAVKAVKLTSRRGCPSILTDNKLNPVRMSFGNTGHFKYIWKGLQKRWFHLLE